MESHQWRQLAIKHRAYTDGMYDKLQQWNQRHLMVYIKPGISIHMYDSNSWSNVVAYMEHLAGQICDELYNRVHGNCSCTWNTDADDTWRAGVIWDTPTAPGAPFTTTD